jgi:hypothetical protein
MQIIEAKNFLTRESIEQEVRKLAGGDTKPNPDFQIQGSVEELSNLNLSESSTIFGVGVKII